MRAAFALLLLAPLAVAAPVPKEGKETSKLYVTLNDSVTRMNPDGTDAVVLFQDRRSDDDLCVSPDGTRMASLRMNKRFWRWTVELRAEGEAPTAVAEVPRIPDCRWSADGKAVYGTYRETEQEGGGWKLWRVGAADHAYSDVDVPPEYRFGGFTATGDGFFQAAELPKAAVKDRTPAPAGEVVTSPWGKFKPKVVIPADALVRPLAVFPDGKRWLVWRASGGVGVHTAGEKTRLWDRTDVLREPVAVSPNGKRVACVTVTEDSSAYSLCTADPDGTNVTTVLETKKRITHIDWR